MERCPWGAEPEEYRRYHDHEWGRPVTADRAIYEKLCLEGFQSGLSWLTILRKREGFRRAFAGFDPEAVAAFGARDVARLVADPSIVRHRGKIEAAIANARATLAAREDVGSLAALVWRFEPVPGPPPASMGDLPASTPASAAL
ncbi:MAG: DNA-3-methyladenine glycosylase I, partial [Actinomycetota bacterium]